jgi:hypothetical protein
METTAMPNKFIAALSLSFLLGACSGQSQGGSQVSAVRDRTEIVGRRVTYVEERKDEFSSAPCERSGVQNDTTMYCRVSAGDDETSKDNLSWTWTDGVERFLGNRSGPTWQGRVVSSTIDRQIKLVASKVIMTADEVAILAATGQRHTIVTTFTFRAKPSRRLQGHWASNYGSWQFSTSCGSHRGEDEERDEFDFSRASNDWFNFTLTTSNSFDLSTCGNGPVTMTFSAQLQDFRFTSATSLVAPETPVAE